MKLIMCDICKKVQKTSETSTIRLTTPRSDIVYKNSNEYGTITETEIEKDICYDCTVNLLGKLLPDFRILSREDRDKLQKDR